ncbi:MAG TPA: carboxypeptidase-like regulatory domain-containing protein [Vicinamibacterales bacterium]|nr:carboxypeptidase-like regulatory domain-containing protein [Vicinamibacterales bacterium]
MGVWLSLGLLALLLAGGCRRGVPVVDLGPKPPEARGTLSGVVRGPEGTSPIAGRDVHVINTDTGARYTTRTSETGGFTIQVPAGKYRLELPLRDGETLVKRPGLIDLNKSDVDSRIEFVLANVRVSRPRGPAYRLDNGLGSPIT